MINCKDECGQSVEDETVAERSGWTYLSGMASWRCPPCARALARANTMQGKPSDTTFVDRLPPSSIGALRKETASSITPPMVKPYGQK